MNKLYHRFWVSSYKGGELCSKINQTIEDIASSIDLDWDVIFDRFADDEKSANMSDEKFSSLSCGQLLDMLDDQNLKDIATDNIYPGNSYAFDSYSDSEFFTVNENGELEYVDIIEEPGFIEAFRKSLLKNAEYWDNIKK